MTFEGILHLIKKLRLLNVSISINFYQNQFINECAREKKAKISYFQSFPVSEFFCEMKKNLRS